MDCSRTLAMVLLVSALGLLSAGRAMGQSDTPNSLGNSCASMPKNGCVLRASWYGERFHGQPMSNGKTFNMLDPSIAAHKDLPFGTRLWLTYQKTGRSIEVVVRDRGPYVLGRSLDLSFAAAEKLGFRREGHVELTVDYVVVPAPKGASKANHSGRAKQFGS